MTEDKKKSDLILDEVKRRKGGDKIVDVEEEKVKLVIFTLLGDYYAFYGEAIKEILPLGNIFYVPGSPSFILGVVNVRGDIESVISINAFIGLPESGMTPKSRVAMAVKEGVRSGILVDTIEEVIDIPVSSIKPALSTLDKSQRELVAGEAVYNNKTVTILDIGGIFGKIAA